MKTCIFVFVFLQLLSTAIAAEFKEFKIGNYTFAISNKFDKNRSDFLIADLTFLASIPDSSKATPLHKILFGDSISGQAYIKWFAKRILYFSPGQNADSSAGYGLLDIKNLGRVPSVIVNDIYFQEKQLLRISILLHEARHADGKSYEHTFCFRDLPLFFLADKLPRNTNGNDSRHCDLRWDGSYGVQLIFLFNLQKFTNLYNLDKKAENLFFAGRFSSRNARCMLSVDFWPDLFKSEDDCI